MNKLKRKIRRNLRRDVLFHWKPTFIREAFDNLSRMKVSKAFYFSNAAIWRREWRNKYYNAKTGKH